MNMYTRVFRNISMSCLLILPVTGWGVPGELADKPLFLGGGNVPGNMVLVPSVEWPTIESVANITNTYTSAQRFEGYFDSAKCYQYNYSSTESERHFSPSSMAGTNRQCAGSGEWSGNFLNWATTQTVDPFRKALTGGLRVRDTPTETWLEKARHPGQGNGFPIRDLNNATEVAGATPGVQLRTVLAGPETGGSDSAECRQYPLQYLWLSERQFGESGWWHSARAPEVCWPQYVGAQRRFNRQRQRRMGCDYRCYFCKPGSCRRFSDPLLHYQ